MISYIEDLKERYSQHPQKFPNIPIKIWACQLWEIKKWNVKNIAFPYWQILWNMNSGGVVGYGENTYQMQTDCLYIIPPKSIFFSYYDNKDGEVYNKAVVGERICNCRIEELSHIAEKSLVHLYLRFNLGMPYDYLPAKVYEIKLNQIQEDGMHKMMNFALSCNEFSIAMTMELQAVILRALTHIPTEDWQSLTLDKRVLKVMRYIDKNVDKNLTNEELGGLVFMAPNSLARIFKKNTDITLQQFVRERKIAAACSLFDHDESIGIGEVASKLAFKDRYHFSKVFKQVKKMAPGEYRNKKTTHLPQYDSSDLK